VSERGSVTVWLLGLVVAVLFLGGLSLDLWRVFSHRQELVGLADAAAIVGAGAIDEATFRAGQGVRLDPVRARQQAVAYLRPRVPAGTSLRLRAGSTFISVRLHGSVRLSLLGLLAPQSAIPVSGAATVEPRRAP
jgi:hypothetical protein